MHRISLYPSCSFSCQHRPRNHVNFPVIFGCASKGQQPLGSKFKCLNLTMLELRTTYHRNKLWQKHVRIIFQIIKKNKLPLMTHQNVSWISMMQKRRVCWPRLENLYFQPLWNLQQKVINAKLNMELLLYLINYMKQDYSVKLNSVYHSYTHLRYIWKTNLLEPKNWWDIFQAFKDALLTHISLFGCS